MTSVLSPLAAKARPESDHAEERRQLAAAFRWTARLNMHEGIANHFSLAVSADGRRFLINPCGRHFARLRASDLILLDADDADAARRAVVDPTAWAIHGALHRRAPQARCVMHVHSKFAVVLATLRDPEMPPIDQNSMRFYNRLAVDRGYDGMGLGEEGERLACALGDRKVLLLGNHGFLTAASSVAEAFDLLYYFERAAETLVTALATGRPLSVVSPAVAEKTARQWEDYPADMAAAHLAEIRAILDREEPDYRD